MNTLLFARGSDGNLRGFYNVCRHRAVYRQIATTHKGGTGARGREQGQTHFLQRFRYGKGLRTFKYTADRSESSADLMDR